MLVYLQYLLIPFSSIYWLITYIRNVLFDKKILESTEFSIPIISVGNITVGGTGKTPHVQYLINLLEKSYNTAVLSRGYKRQSEGYILSNAESTISEIGDEPYQLKKKFPNVTVAVCEKRVVGVQKLLQDIPKLETIILDDAFQHRAIKPGLQILLIDYNRPLWKDFVFPGGYLREGRYAKKRADIIIVSKCPDTLTEKQKDTWKRKLGITTQPIFFTKIAYGNIYEATTKKEYSHEEILSAKQVLIITGIAQPKPIYKLATQYSDFVTLMAFPDHHNFTDGDYDAFLVKYKTYGTNVITTEKDAQKIVDMTRKQIPTYVLPITTVFIDGNEDGFKKLILDFVSK